MKFSTREYVEAPVDAIFAALTDFDAWERAAMRRGAKVRRQDGSLDQGSEAQWGIDFMWRGRLRSVTVRLVSLVPNERVMFVGEGASAQGQLVIDLLAMGPRRTRLHVGLDVRPKTLAARLFIQTLRLARAKVMKSFETRVKVLAADLEERARQQSR